MAKSTINLCSPFCYSYMFVHKLCINTANKWLFFFSLLQFRTTWDSTIVMENVVFHFGGCCTCCCTYLTDLGWSYLPPLASKHWAVTIAKETLSSTLWSALWVFRDLGRSTWPTRDDRVVPSIQVGGEAWCVGEALVQPHVLLVLLRLLLGPVGAASSDADARQRRVLVPWAARARKAAIRAPQPQGWWALLTHFMHTAWMHNHRKRIVKKKVIPRQRDLDFKKRPRL